MGAYHDSAPEVKRLPTKVVFQPVLQQNGLVDELEQCFWESQKRIPSLLQWRGRLDDLYQRSQLLGGPR